MGKLEDLTSAIDAETNVVAAKIDKLTAELTEARATGAPPKPETLAALSAISDRLKAIGADPFAPIPAAALAVTPAPAPADPAAPTP